jgi:hypothetical protein
MGAGWERHAVSQTPSTRSRIWAGTSAGVPQAAMVYIISSSIRPPISPPQAGGAPSPALLGHRVEFGLQILPAVCGQHRPVSRGRPVERQQLPGAGVDSFPVGVSVARRHDDLGNDGELVGLPAAGLQAVGVLGGGPSQLGPKGADVDRRRTVGVRAGAEGRRHQRVPVVLASKVQAATRIPRLEDCAQGRDHLDHAVHRMVELGPEPLLDLRADLSAKAEEKSPATQQLVVIGLVHQMYRIARKRDRHIRHQAQTAHRGSQRQRSERVVLTFERGNTLAPASRSARARSAASVSPYNAVTIFKAPA